MRSNRAFGCSAVGNKSQSSVGTNSSVKMRCSDSQACNLKHPTQDNKQGYVRAGKSGGKPDVGQVPASKTSLKKQSR